MKLIPIHNTLLVALCVLGALAGCGDSSSPPLDTGASDSAPADSMMDAAGDSAADSGPLAMAGARCDSNDECVSGQCQTEADAPVVPGGMCIRGCRESFPEDCPDGTVCREAADLICTPTCVETADCDAGRLCFPEPDPDGSGLTYPGICIGHCQRDSECVSGVCNPYLGICTALTVTDRGGSWDSCTSDADCLSDWCEPTVGACIVLCAPDLPACPEAGDVCVDDLGFPTYGTCRPTCANNEDCETGRCGLVDGQMVCD